MENERRSYVKQLKGFKKKGKEKMIYKLTKVLYELKQAPRVWYMKLDMNLTSIHLIKSSYGLIVYFKHTKDFYIIVSVYVNDLLVTRNVEAKNEEFKPEIIKLLEMKNLGLFNFYLGIEVHSNRR